MSKTTEQWEQELGRVSSPYTAFTGEHREAVSEVVRLRRELEGLKRFLESRASSLLLVRQYVAASGSSDAARKIKKILEGNNE